MATIYELSKRWPGPLLRCYLDRIHHPEHLEKRQYVKFDKKLAEKLECEECKVVIGTPFIYEKEERPAYHMRPGFFAIKKVRKKSKSESKWVQYLGCCT